MSHLDELDMILRTQIRKFFSLSEISLAELTMLTNFSQIRLSEVSLADLTILTNFRHFRYCMHFWTYLLNSAGKCV